MLIVKIIGGIGNQMFQYAFYRKLIELGKKVKCDIKGFNNYKLHSGFELQRVFDLDIDFAEPFEIEKLTSIYNYNILSRLKRKIFGYPSTHLIESNILVENLNNIEDAYLDGYWQSTKFFGDFNELKSKFNFNKKLNFVNQKTLKKISCTNSVSMHVRRGDYLGNSVYNLCDESYFLNAIKIIQAREKKELEIFVFSDDMIWVKKCLFNNFKEKININLIENNTQDSSVDLRLMTQCKHNIISNSSFSWWGAWLNKHNNKNIIAPKKWYKNPNQNFKQIQSLPKSWITI